MEDDPTTRQRSVNEHFELTTRAENSGGSRRSTHACTFVVNSHPYTLVRCSPDIKVNDADRKSLSVTIWAGAISEQYLLSSKRHALNK